MMEGKKRQLTGLWVFLKGKGRIWILLGGALAGLLLILIGNSLTGLTDEAETERQQLHLSELEGYTASLEAELVKLCGAVSGVSQVEVMVTLESGSSIVYAVDGSGKPVTVGNGSNEAPLYATLYAPTVAGVGIVCRGGNNPITQQKLISLVSTALDISASRVFVTGK